MSKKYLTWLSALLTALLVISIVGCGTQNTTSPANTSDNNKAQATKTVIRFSQGLPEQHYIAKQFRAWADFTMEKAKGQLEIQIYPSAQLYKDSDVVEAIQTGAIESGLVYPYTLAKIVPKMRVFDVPFLYDGKDGKATELFAKVLNSPIRTRIEEDIEKQGMKMIMAIPWGVEDLGFVLNKQVKTVADAKGLTIRVLNPEGAAVLKQWGSNASFLNGSELYQGLQRGVLQGSHAAVTTSVERKLYEVAPYFTIMPMGAQLSGVVINKKFYDNLKPELQKAMTDAAKEVESKTVEVVKSNNAVIFKAAADKGIKIYTPTPEELKQFYGDTDKLWQSIYKDNPQILADIKEIQEIKASLK